MEKVYVTTVKVGKIPKGTVVTKEKIGERFDAFVKKGYIVEKSELVSVPSSQEGEVTELKAQLNTKTQELETLKTANEAFMKQILELKDLKSLQALQKQMQEG